MGWGWWDNKKKCHNRELMELMSCLILIILIIPGKGRDYRLRNFFSVSIRKYLNNGSKHETCFYKCAF